MILNHEQIEGLTRLIGITRDTELNCNECLDRVAEFAEAELCNLPISGALEAVKHHLELCTECREEYEALLEMLKRVDTD